MFEKSAKKPIFLGQTSLLATTVWVQKAFFSFNSCLYKSHFVPHFWRRMKSMDLVGYQIRSYMCFINEALDSHLEPLKKILQPNDVLKYVSYLKKILKRVSWSIYSAGPQHWLNLQHETDPV